MKEKERKELLKLLKKQKEGADKLIEEFNEESKKFFLEISNKTDNPKDKVGLLDTIISYQYECKHEYGLHNSDDSFIDKDCYCLDCGEYLDRKDIGVLFETDRIMSKVRNEYLELIQEMSVADSFMTLKRKYNFKRK